MYSTKKIKYFSLDLTTIKGCSTLLHLICFSRILKSNITSQYLCSWCPPHVKVEHIIPLENEEGLILCEVTIFPHMEVLEGPGPLGQSTLHLPATVSESNVGNEFMKMICSVSVLYLDRNKIKSWPSGSHKNIRFHDQGLIVDDWYTTFTGILLDLLLFSRPPLDNNLVDLNYFVLSCP